MSRAKPLFKENDVARAIRAAVKAGIEVARVMVDPSGNIVVIAAGEGDAPPNNRKRTGTPMQAGE
jgi:hypothetical protein